MAYQSLIFDRVRVNRVELADVLPDGKVYTAYIENIGEGRPVRGTVRVEVNGSALGCLDEPVEPWVRKTIRLIANAQANDGHKVQALIERAPISLDSRYVLSPA